MLELIDISKKLGAFRLGPVQLRIEQGSYFCLAGRSGAGKSVLLELMAGLKMPDSGRILWKGTDLTLTPANKRGFGLLFQDNQLFPHFTVKRNIAYAMHRLGIERKNADLRLKKWAEKLELVPLLDRYPSGLSGGEAKRVALARVLAMEPSILLLDEPLISLDASLQRDMRALLRRLHREGQTILHVTHDYREAYALAGELAVIGDGKLVQQGSPGHVFTHPANAFVAEFTGLKNYFNVIRTHAPGNGTCSFLLDNNFSIELAVNHTETPSALIIPEDGILLFQHEAEAGPGSWKVKLIDKIPTPGGFEIELDAGGKLFVKLTDHQLKDIPENGSTMWCRIKPECVRMIR